jgi:tetratricopeptide (TPR) repeat protein
MWLSSTQSGPSVEQLGAERLGTEARDAAARAHFVYPPADDAAAPTAYQKIIELEGVEHPAAGEIAVELRREFAGTLTYLGDHFWERPGGRPFAVDYYAQAVLFDDSDPRVQARAYLTHGQRAELQAKAENGDFAAEELIAAEPLLVLADLESLSGPMLAGLADRPTVGSLRLQRSFEDLAEAYGGLADENANQVAAQGPEAPLPAQAQNEPSTTRTPPKASDSKGAEKATGEIAADPGHAREIAASGRGHFQTGNWQLAERSFNQALAADPRCADALIGLSDVYFERDRSASAIEFAKRAIRVAPKRSEFHLKLGDAHFRASEFAAARRAYELAASLGSSEAKRRIARLTAKLEAGGDL